MKRTAPPSPDPPLPKPPTSFNAAPLPVVVVAARCWVRIHRHDRPGSGPLVFGRVPAGRFDASNGQFGVLYAAQTVDGAFVEVFRRNPVPGQTKRVIDDQELGIRSLATCSSRKLRLVDLTGDGLSKLGLDASIIATRRYDISRAWAAAFHGHPQKPDGILYRSRHDPEQICPALFQRASSKLTLRSNDNLAGKDGQRRMAPSLAKYNVGVAASARHGKRIPKQGKPT